MTKIESYLYELLKEGLSKESDQVKEIERKSWRMDQLKKFNDQFIKSFEQGLFQEAGITVTAFYTPGEFNEMFIELRGPKGNTIKLTESKLDSFFNKVNPLSILHHSGRQPIQSLLMYIVENLLC